VTDTTMPAASAADELPIRRHELPGLYNLRDTGGYRAEAGTTRWGKLFRSDALHRLDEAGRARLAELGIAHIVDLRGDDERRTAPSRMDASGITVHHLPVFDDAAPASRAGAALGLASVYDHMVDERGGNLVRAIRIIADADDDQAVLVHCTAGKDRTGLVVAFALLAAGVERDEVVADYAATAQHLAGEWADLMLEGVRVAGREITPGLLELMTESPAPVLDALLDRIDREHGSITAYLAANGLTDSERERLAATLID
jgi:protein-tyrosine phosphatase